MIEECEKPVELRWRSAEEEVEEAERRVRRRITRWMAIVRAKTKARRAPITRKLES